MIIALTVLACGVGVPIEASRLAHRAQTIVVPRGDAEAQVTRRAQAFATKLGQAANAGSPTDADIHRLALTSNVSIQAIDRRNGLVVDIGAGQTYGFGLDGQSILNCFRVTTRGPNAAPTMVEIECTRPTPATSE